MWYTFVNFLRVGSACPGNDPASPADVENRLLPCLKLTFYFCLSKQYVDDFVGEMTFQNHLIDTFCEIKLWCTHLSTFVKWGVWVQETPRRRKRAWKTDYYHVFS